MSDSKVIHVNNTPGLFYEFTSNRFQVLEEEGYAPSLETRERAQDIWEQLGETGPVEICK